MSAPAIAGRRAEAPPVSPAQPAAGGRAGWLSELLTRASHEAEAPAPREAPPPRSVPAEAARPERHGIDSLESLAVDIARMIDHDAAAELWDRYKRGERNVFTRKLYTMQGQRAFEEGDSRWHYTPAQRRVRGRAQPRHDPCVAALRRQQQMARCAIR